MGFLGLSVVLLLLSWAILATSVFVSCSGDDEAEAHGGDSIVVVRTDGMVFAFNAFVDSPPLFTGVDVTRLRLPYVFYSTPLDSAQTCVSVEI